MSKSLCRLLYLLSLLSGIISALLLGRGYASNPVLLNHVSFAHLLQPAPVFIGMLLALVASILLLIAWIGALIRSAQLHRWGWFICLLLFSSIALFFYVFFGPRIPPYEPRVTMTTPPYGGFGD